MTKKQRKTSAVVFCNLREESSLLVAENKVDTILEEDLSYE
jgi:hypothetical protein